MSPLRYRIAGDRVEIEHRFRGRSIPFTLAASEDRRTLLACSKNTGNT